MGRDRMLGRGAKRRSADPAPTAADAQGVERYAGVIAAYLARICPPDAVAPLTRRALTEVARAGGAEMVGAPAAAVVTRAARAAAFDELEREAKRLRRRARRLTSLRWGCSDTPRLLRSRADGAISKAGLNRLYRHLDRCERCAGLAGRCDHAEWHLEVGLTGAPVGSGDGPVERPPVASYLRTRAPAAPATAGGGASRGGAAPRPRAARGAAAGPGAAPVLPRQPVKPASGALAHWAPAAGGRASSDAGGNAAPKRRAGTGRRLAGGLCLVVVLVVGLALALDAGGRRSNHRSGVGRAAPAPAPAAAPAVNAPPAPAPAVVRGLRRPFMVDGARFAVFRDPNQGWTGFTATNPGPGRRWVAVTVRVRNLTRTAFDPRVLAYRILDATGAAFRPELRFGTGPALLRAPRPLPGQGLVETRLGFRVSRRTAGLRLRFSPGSGTPSIVVGLGR